MRLAFVKCHGSGNDFPLIDAREIALQDDAWAAVARALGDRAGPVGGDGLLLLTRGRGAAAFGMRMLNPDGSEAETCLNGLRCVARLGLGALGIDAATVALKTSTAEVALVAPLATEVVTVRTVAGPASTDPAAVGIHVDARVIDTTIDALPSTRRFTAVAMPNPHLLSFGTIDDAALIALGMWCEAQPPLLADRANVSFVETRGNDLYVRTFERGVGLTDACGSAMAAATYAAALTDRIAWDTAITVFSPGGRVRASAARDCRIMIEGNATFEWAGEIEVDLRSGTASDLRVTARYATEVTAWAAVAAAR